jgi:2-oxoglutarate/2-oxoacid ferredoxin oxidoreductase subunit beta
MVELKDYGNFNTAWCPGCGNFAIVNSLKEALVKLGKFPHEVLLVSGIGQAAKLPHYLNCNVFNGLHGRPIPVATGAKIANKNLLVIVTSGDGDIYGEGGNHFLHAIRRNIDIKVFVHNNQVYGLTKGQASPTSDEGFVTKVQTHGVILEPFNPISLAVALDAAFVARSSSGDIGHLSMMMQEAIKHRGFALVDILQPCPTFNKKNTWMWYKQRIYDVNKDAGYNPADKSQAFLKSQEWGDKIPVGVIYKKDKPTFEDRTEVIKDHALIDIKLDPAKLLPLVENFK